MNKTTLIPLPVLFFALLFSAAMALLQHFQPALLYQRESVLTGEAWRIWTGHLVHTNDYHFYINLAGFWIFLLLCGSVMTVKLLIFSIILGATCISTAFLWHHPQLVWYAGLSGVLYGLFVTGAICLAVAGEIFSFIALIALLLLKFSSVWFADSDAVTTGLIDAPIVEEAHLYGAIAGLVPPIPRVVQMARGKPPS